MEDVTLDAIRPLPIDALMNAMVPRLQRYVRGSFPAMCHGHAEDAVQEVFLCALEHPDRFERAWSEGGQLRLEGLCRLIAWRSARGRWQRAATRRELGGDALHQQRAARAPGQELVADLRMQLDGVIERAIQAIAPAQAGQAHAALVDRFMSGDSDTEVAARHGLRREYLNRIKREVQRSFLDPLA